MTTMLFVAGHYRKGDTGLISSRIGLETEAEMFRDGDDLYGRVAEHHDHTTVHCVFVDEAQFLEEEQVWQLARIADRLNIPVMCYGLRTDFQGKLFSSGSRALLAIADDLRRSAHHLPLAAARLTMVVRLGADGKVARQGEQVAIGKDVYVSLCRPPLGREMGRAAPDDFIGFTRASIYSGFIGARLRSAGGLHENSSIHARLSVSRRRSGGEIRNAANAWAPRGDRRGSDGEFYRRAGPSAAPNCPPQDHRGGRVAAAPGKGAVPTRPCM